MFYRIIAKGSTTQTPIQWVATKIERVQDYSLVMLGFTCLHRGGTYDVWGSDKIRPTLLKREK